jgi:hypothetical protein
MQMCGVTVSIAAEVMSLIPSYFILHYNNKIKSLYLNLYQNEITINEVIQIFTYKQQETIKRQTVFVCIGSACWSNNRICCCYVKDACELSARFFEQILRREL